MRSRREILKKIGAFATVLASTSTSFAFLHRLNDNLFAGLNVNIIHSGSKFADLLASSYNKLTQKTPARRLLPYEGTTVARIVERLVSADEGFAVRSGGHCFAGFSQHQETVIDLRQLSEIKIDEEQQFVTIGAGAQLGHVYRYLARYGLTIPGGTNENVGFGGHVLGGGFGYFSRRDGMLCDQLVSLKIALASGQQIEISEDNHPDLFWACKGGGGGSLGIATEFKFRATPVSNLHVIDITERASPQRAARILYAWQHWSRLRMEHTTHLHMSRYTENSCFVRLTGISETKNRAVLMQELPQVLDRIEAIHPNYITSGTMASVVRKLYPKANKHSDEFLSRSDYVDKTITQEGVWNFVKMLMQYPPNSTKFVFEALGGAIAKVPSTATAFPHRNAQFMIQYTGEIRKPDHREIRKQAMAHATSMLSPFVTGGAYVNYPDLNLENWQHAYWGDNFARLQDVKRKYDPNNVFRHPHSIPL